MEHSSRIKTPDQRLRVFISSTGDELGDERRAASEAVQELRLSPVLHESGARPHSREDVSRAYVAQSHIFIGIYWQSYGRVAPDSEISEIEAEMALAGDMPRLIYIKRPAPKRDPRLEEMLQSFRSGGAVSYRIFETPEELRELIKDDLVVTLTERFEQGSDPSQASPTSDHLPSFVNQFVGRDRELREVTEMLMDDEVRLVTLTGPGGIGKSRLALEAGAALKDRFEDGVHLVMLESVRDPSLVLSTIASTLQVPDSLNMFGDPLVQFLQRRRLLLILDNLEQVLPAATDVVRLLEESPALKILVTSRVLLNVRGEREVAVPILGVPRNGARDVDSLARYEAIQLFVARVRASDPSFELTSDNARAVAEICKRLDGLPLALELAAARSRLFPPEVLIARLDRGFGILTGGAADLPERHRALKTTIAWSVDLLGSGPRELFMRLAAFRGGWTLDAAEVVCGVVPGCDVMNDMQALLESSLIRTSADEDEPRFTMLETVREFAAELLERSAHSGAIEEAHARYFFDLVKTAGAGLRTREQGTWLGRLEADHDNIRAAFGWAMAHDEPERVAEGGWSLWIFWWIRAHLTEGLRCMMVTLGRSEELSDEARSRAMAVAGVMHFWRADFGEALPLIASALEDFRTTGDGTGIALCQLALGFMEASASEPSAAFARFDEAREIFEGQGDLWGRVLSLNAICWLALSLDVEDVPEERFEQAVALADQIGLDADRAMAIGNLGRRRLFHGDLAEAEELMNEALEIFASNSVLSSASYILDSFAELAIVRGERERAALFFGAAEGMRRASQFPLLPFLQGRWASWTSRLKKEIGERAFQAGFDEGLEMTLEEALAYAQPSRVDG